METFHDRLHRLVKERDMSLSSLAKSVGVTAESFYVGLKRPDWRPRQGTLRLIAKSLKTSPEYLLTGLRPGPEGTQVGTMVPLAGSLQRVPVFKLNQVSAGLGTPQFGGAVADDHKHIPPEMTEGATGQLAMIKVNGDSMAPGIRHGDYVIVEQRDDWHPQSKIYVIKIDGETLLKRVHRVGKRLKIISDNDAYPTLELGPDDETQVQVVARYLGLQRNGEP